MLHLKGLVIAQVLCLQHMRDGQEVLHLKDLGVDITTEELRFFLLDAGWLMVPRLATTKRGEKRE